MRTATTILVATDLSAGGDAAVDTAFRLASKYDAEVHVLHVFLPYEECADARTADLVDESERMAEHRLRDSVQLRASSVRRGKVVLRRGTPPSLIVETARELGADLLVLGTRDRQSLDRVRLGGVAESVIHRAPCSVLVVRGPAR